MFSSWHSQSVVVFAFSHLGTPKVLLNSNQNPYEFIETYWKLIKIHPHSLKSNQHPSQVHWIPIKIRPKWGLQGGLQWVHPNSKKNSNPNVSIFLYNPFVQNAFLGRREPITTSIPKPHINFGGTGTHVNLGGVRPERSIAHLLEVHFLTETWFTTNCLQYSAIIAECNRAARFSC